MLTESRSEHLGNVEMVVSGRIVDAGPDHLTIRDLTVGEDVTVRIDDRTNFSWFQARHEGRLTDTAQVRVGYFIAGGIHTASEVLVMEPGDGSPIAGPLAPHVH
jgi:hypothetical protein